VITSSSFQYSQKPDKVEAVVLSAKRGGRYYRLTWKNAEAEKVQVTEKLRVTLAFLNVLPTRAALSYDGDVTSRFADFLSVDREKGIDPEDPELEEICGDIRSHASSAEEAVELICDWINENIQPGHGGRTSRECLRRRKGNCVSMSQLGCAMARKLKIPADLVEGRVVGEAGGTRSGAGHVWFEVYYPDAGWVFYDPTWHERGFRRLDCIAAVGRSCRVTTPEGSRILEGDFIEEKSTGKHTTRYKLLKTLLRSGPKGMKVLGIQVVPKPPPRSAKVRHLPIRAIISESSIEPGKRRYSRSRQYRR
jgi:hypothetical protein